MFITITCQKTPVLVELFYVGIAQNKKAEIRIRNVISVQNVGLIKMKLKEKINRVRSLSCMEPQDIHEKEEDMNQLGVGQVKAVKSKKKDINPDTGKPWRSEKSKAYRGGKGPKYKILKDNKKPLTDEERAYVMKEKAVWHHGKNGEATPAVWKSEVKGKTYYVTNTHRAYNATSDLSFASQFSITFVTVSPGWLNKDLSNGWNPWVNNPILPTLGISFNPSC